MWQAPLRTPSHACTFSASSANRTKPSQFTSSYQAVMRRLQRRCCCSTAGLHGGCEVLLSRPAVQVLVQGARRRLKGHLLLLVLVAQLLRC